MSDDNELPDEENNVSPEDESLATDTEYQAVDDEYEAVDDEHDDDEYEAVDDEHDDEYEYDDDDDEYEYEDDTGFDVSELIDRYVPFLVSDGTEEGDNNQMLYTLLAIAGVWLLIALCIGSSVLYVFVIRLPEPTPIVINEQATQTPTPVPTETFTPAPAEPPTDTPEPSPTPTQAVPPTGTATPTLTFQQLAEMAGFPGTNTPTPIGQVGDGTPSPETILQTPEDQQFFSQLTTTAESLAVAVRSLQALRVEPRPDDTAWTTAVGTEGNAINRLNIELQGYQVPSAMWTPTLMAYQTAGTTCVEGVQTLFEGINQADPVLLDLADTQLTTCWQQIGLANTQLETMLGAISGP